MDGRKGTPRKPSVNRSIYFFNVQLYTECNKQKGKVINYDKSRFAKTKSSKIFKRAEFTSIKVREEYRHSTHNILSLDC